jgi:predicted DNA-binding transcriptional regulator AlpA
MEEMTSMVPRRAKVKRGRGRPKSTPVKPHPTPAMPMPALNLPRLVNEDQLAEYLGMASSTLRKWRSDGVGPKFIKLGGTDNGCIRYAENDIAAYIEVSSRTIANDGRDE